MNTLCDQLGRPLTDLRISVTDRCNFRCTFCMPEDRTYEFLPRAEVLSYEELVQVARVFVSRGVRKIRLTGGEPLLRRDIEHLIANLAAIEGLDDLALTTNGLLLPGRAKALKAAGLQRVTISLHSLDPDLFGRLAGGRGSLEGVLDGVEAAAAAGLTPVKINTVVIRGVNDHEIVTLAERFKSELYVLRFIEFMDVGTLNDWDSESVVSAREIIQRVAEEFPLEPAARRHSNDVALRYRYLDGGGEVGVIASITEPFCGDCSRARVSADGSFYTCLFSSQGHDLKSVLRGPGGEEALGRRIDDIWKKRSDRYSEERAEQIKAGRIDAAARRVEMFRIGG